MKKNKLMLIMVILLATAVFAQEGLPPTQEEMMKEEAIEEGPLAPLPGEDILEPEEPPSIEPPEFDEPEAEPPLTPPPVKPPETDHSGWESNSKTGLNYRIETTKEYGYSERLGTYYIEEITRYRQAENPRTGEIATYGPDGNIIRVEKDGIGYGVGTSGFGEAASGFPTRLSTMKAGGETYQTGGYYTEFNDAGEVIGLSYRNNEGARVAGVTEGGEYVVYDAQGNPNRVTSTQMQERIQERIEQQALEDAGIAGKTDAELSAEERELKEKIEDTSEKEAKKQATELQKERDMKRLGIGCSGTAWRCIGNIMRAYDEYKGIGELTAMLIPDYQEWSRNLRQTISQSFCAFTGIQSCAESLICGAVFDISSDSVLADGTVMLGRGPSGLLTSGTISGTKSLPIALRGVPRQELMDIMGSEIVVINGKVMDLTDPTIDTNSLSLEARLYTVQYSITNNAEGGQDLKYNLIFKGPSRQAKWYPEDKKLGQGESKTDTHERFSATEYDEVCLTFNPKLPSTNSAIGTIARPSYVDKICKPLAEYQGGATTIGGESTNPEEPGSVQQQVQNQEGLI